MSKPVRLLLLVRVLTGLLTLSVLAVGPATASDGDDDGGGGVRDAVFGGGLLAEAPTISFSVDVSSGPLGENPTGTFRVENTQPPGGFIVAEATCLVVTGNTATIGGRITERSGVGFDPISFAVGRGVLFTTQDNNPATPAPDRVSGFQSVPTPPTNQASCITQPMFFTVDGDVTVQDNIAGGSGDDQGDDDDQGEDGDDDTDG